MANTRSLEAKVVRLARKLGYASAKYLKVWRGYDVYRAFDDESMADVESPWMVLLSFLRKMAICGMHLLTRQQCSNENQQTRYTAGLL